MATRNSVSRFDAASFRFDDVTGDLHVPVTPTRPGVYLYKNPLTGAIQRELRSDAEVFKADSLQTLEGKPFTNDHPKDANGKFIFLTPDTTKQHQTGLFYGSHTVSSDGVHTQGMVVISDPEHIALIKAGKQAVSCGYKCDEDYTPGVDPKYGPYDMAQKNIRHNHLANVYRGRMGEGAKLRFDSARFDAEEIDPEEMGEMKPDDETAEDKAMGKMDSKQSKMGNMAEKMTNKAKGQEKKKRMATLKLDHGEFEIDNDLDIALKVKFAADKQATETEKGRADTAETALTAEKARAERLDAELVTARHDLKEYNEAKAAEVRKGLELSAKRVLGEGQKFDGLTDREIKEQSIEKALPWAKDDKPLGERSDEWIDTMYSVATRPTAEAPGPSAAFQKVIAASVKPVPAGQRADADPNDPEAARREMLDYIQNEHKAGRN